MSEVLLVTCARMPEGEEWTGTSYLLDACRAAGIDARWVVWDDPAIDWGEGLVAVRSTWDYDERRQEFLAWARRVPWMLNGPEIFAWNTDKTYLTALADRGVPVVPTRVVREAGELAAAVSAYSAAVVKPCVGAGGRGVWHGPPDRWRGPVSPGPWIVQPLVESVRTEGEVSVFVLDGEVVSQAQKRPAAGEIRVHETYGGRSRGVPVTREAAGVARAAVTGAQDILGRRLDYARADQMRLADGRLAVGELEVTEPGLYLDVLPENASVFASLLQRRLANPPPRRRL